MHLNAMISRLRGPRAAIVLLLLAGLMLFYEPVAHGRPPVVAAILLIAAGFCAWHAAAGARRAAGKSERDAPRLTWPSWVMGALSALVFGFLLATAAPAWFPPSHADLVASVRQFAAPADDPIAWRRFGEMARWLGESGTDPLDLSLPARAVQAAIDATPEPRSWLLGGAARADILSQDAMRRLAGDRHARELLETNEAPVDYIDQRVATLHALVRTGALEPAARIRLARRLLQSWPDPRTRRSLEQMALLCEVAALLDAEYLLPPQRESVHRALLTCWGAERWMLVPLRGFTDEPAPGAHPDLDASNAALDLMQRFGVPAGVDLRELRAELRAETRRRFLWFDTIRRERLFATMVLEKLERRFPLPRAPVGRTIVEHGVDLAALLLGALCVLATPRMGPVAARRPHLA